MGKIKQLGRAMGGGLLGLCLNRKMRRMIVVVTTATYLHTLNRSGECKLGELNKACNLSYNASALDFPAAVGDKLWKGSELDNLDLHGGHDSIVTKILDNIPPWLRYGRISDMRTDVTNAVDFALQ